MPTRDLRSQFLDLIMDQVRSNRFPSTAMLDRIEQTVADRGAAEDYVRQLISTMSEERFPSPMLLERVAGLIEALERRA